MNQAYGELMRVLLDYRDGFTNEAEFRAFALEHIRTLVVDLRDFGIEISLRPQVFCSGPSVRTPETKKAAAQ